MSFLTTDSRKRDILKCAHACGQCGERTTAVEVNSESFSASAAGGKLSMVLPMIRMFSSQSSVPELIPPRTLLYTYSK